MAKKIKFTEEEIRKALQDVEKENELPKLGEVKKDTGIYHIGEGIYVTHHGWKIFLDNMQVLSKGLNNDNTNEGNVSETTEE